MPDITKDFEIILNSANQHCMRRRNRGVEVRRILEREVRGAPPDEFEAQANETQRRIEETVADITRDLLRLVFPGFFDDHIITCVDQNKLGLLRGDCGCDFQV